MEKHLKFFLPSHSFFVTDSEVQSLDPDVLSFTESSWGRRSPNKAVVSSTYSCGHNYGNINLTI